MKRQKNVFKENWEVQSETGEVLSKKEVGEMKKFVKQFVDGKTLSLLDESEFAAFMHDNDYKISSQVIEKNDSVAFAKLLQEHQSQILFMLVETNDINPIDELLQRFNIKNTIHIGIKIVDKTNTGIRAVLLYGRNKSMEIDDYLFSDNTKEIEKAFLLMYELKKPSTTFLQRTLSWGYPRAARAMDYCCEAGIFKDAEEGGKDFGMTKDEFKVFLKENKDSDKSFFTKL